MIKKRWIKTFRKLHKWPGVIIALIAIQFAFSGLILNHRQIFSSYDISRKWLPNNYTYKNWNMQALRGGFPTSADSLLLFGDIGVWQYNGHSFLEQNNGFKKGTDNHKVYKVIPFKQYYVAATHFGLYCSTNKNIHWNKTNLAINNERITDIFIKQDTLIVLSRDYLLKTSDLTNFTKITIAPPIMYSKHASTFQTLWELHSGELFGKYGKLFVDLLGIICIVLAFTGLLHFFFPVWIKRKKKRTQQTGNLSFAYRTNLHWHNKLGYIFVFFLIITTLTGMFLRPPLLIAIAQSKTKIITGTHLDTPNAWNDKLRRGTWNDRLKCYIFSTSDGFYKASANLSQPPVSFKNQPPVSIMGCNVFEPINETDYLVGSFSGLFYWSVAQNTVSDFFTLQAYKKPQGMSRPISNHMISGWISDVHNAWYLDYNHGLIPLNKSKIMPMPRRIKTSSSMSLWNFALELHTGRIFESILGVMYLLYVPLSGICILIVLISGFFIWLLAHRKSYTK